MDKTNVRVLKHYTFVFYDNLYVSKVLFQVV